MYWLWVCHDESRKSNRTWEYTVSLLCGKFMDTQSRYLFWEFPFGWGAVTKRGPHLFNSVKCTGLLLRFLSPLFINYLQFWSTLIACPKYYISNVPGHWSWPPTQDLRSHVRKMMTSPSLIHVWSFPEVLWKEPYWQTLESLSTKFRSKGTTGKRPLQQPKWDWRPKQTDYKLHLNTLHGYSERSPKYVREKLLCNVSFSFFF